MPELKIETRESGKIRDIKGCPLCVEGIMEGRMIEDKTPVWVCDECPAVLFEFSTDINTKHLQSYLGKDHHV